MEHLLVHNFGPISNLDIDIRKVNVFIGEQGVGKSTIAKLLSCCRDVYLYYLISTGDENNLAMTIFGNYGIRHCFGEDTYIEYKSAFGLWLKYCEGAFSVSWDGLSSRAMNKKIFNMVCNCLADTCVKLGYKLSEESSQADKDFIANNFQVVCSNLRTSFYCPAERGIVGVLSKSMATLALNDVPLPRTLLEFMSFFEKARNEYQKYDIPFLNIKYSYSGGEDMISDNNSTVELKNASSGVQSILPLLMVIDYCLDKRYFGSFTVEEPELNLFPTNQMHLLRSLISKTNVTHSALDSWTITTHSPYMLSVLNISLLGGIISERFPEGAEALNGHLALDYIIRPGDIAVYALDGAKTGSCCHNLINESTGLIEANYLDSVSETMASEFNSLYKVYVNLLKSSRNK